MRTLHVLLAAAATSAAGSAASETQYFHRVTGEQVYLYSYHDGEKDRTLVSAKVPAGTWSVAGKATLVNFTFADYGRCSLWAATTQHDVSTTLVGQRDGFTPAATVAMMTVVTTTEPTWIKLRCRQDASGMIHHVYVDPGATLLITRLR